MASAWDLTALINAADPKAGLAERHLFLVRLMEWLRHAPAAAVAAAAEPRTPLPALRLRHLLNQLDRHDELRARVRGPVQAFWVEIDAAALFADFGFGARRTFASELLRRVEARVLPGTPDTHDLAELFRLMFEPEDAAWIETLDAPTLAKAARLLGPGPTTLQAALLDAVTILVSAVHAAGYAPALRHRMEPDLLRDEPFRQLTHAADALRMAFLAGSAGDVRVPAMAASLPVGDTASDAEIEAFIDRIAQLIRSQAAGIAGNLALCGPLVLAVQWLSGALLGEPLLGAAQARYVLQHLTLLGPTALFAAFTGVLLFASSLVAGWAENWFVFHRLDSALAWNPRIVAHLGAARARRWAAWWRQNVSGLAANISLGLMLGLLPAVLAFLGLPIEVRHVTLSTGQLGAAIGALGVGVLAEPALWWCVAGIAATGILNLAVSFWLAFRVALRSRGVRLNERARIAAALWRRLRAQPMSFVLPPRD